MDAKKVLLLFAHPALHKSRLNRRMIERVRNLEGVTFQDLYAMYPEFDIDVVAEQETLARHDVIVFQHPFLWYGAPAIIKEYIDLVYEHGWAYGADGEVLKDKVALHATTTGGRVSAYEPGGFNGFSARRYLLPFEQTAKLCKMRFLPPFVVHGAHRMDLAKMDLYAGEYEKFMLELVAGKIDPDAYGEEDRINTLLD